MHVILINNELEVSWERLFLSVMRKVLKKQSGLFSINLRNYKSKINYDEIKDLPEYQDNLFNASSLKFLPIVNLRSPISTYEDVKTSTLVKFIINDL